MNQLKLALIGSGSLATIIGEVVSKELARNYEILGVLGHVTENTLVLSNKLNCKAYTNLDEVISDQPDYIVEAASPTVVKDMAIKILANGINLIPLSVGALADPAFYDAVKQTALANNSRVHIPSGAVGGLDVLNNAVLMENAKVSITTEKAPKSLNGAPFLKGRKLSLDQAEEVFKGTAKEAIKHFPKNVNVAVATALASAGVDQTNVIIRSIPHTNSNKHEIELLGDTIQVNVSITSTPSANNPKSSELAAYSVIGLLKNLISPITF